MSESAKTASASAVQSRASLVRSNLFSCFMFGLMIITTLLPLTQFLAGLYAKGLLSGYGLSVLGAVVAIPSLMLVITLNNRLITANKKILETSLFKWKKNFSLAVLTSHWASATVYVIAMLVAIPVLAYYEEWIFRSLLTGPIAVLLWGGVAFGFVHMLVGVTVRMALCNGLLGLFLGVAYSVLVPSLGEESALWFVTVVHATYNYLALAVIVYEVRLQRYVCVFLDGDHWLARASKRHLPTAVRWARVFQT